MSSEKKTMGGSCGCSGGNLIAGGSGYGIGVKSAPMMLGPYSGYGKMDPYSPETYDRPLSFQPLVPSILGGRKVKRSIRHKKSSRKSKKVAHKKMSRKVKRVTFVRRNNALRRSSRRIRKSKKRIVKGGSLSFSDFSPSAGVAPSGSQNISSSPNYSVDLSSLGTKMSALANPIPIKAGNNCGK
jgi:hypothetical protein